MSVPFTFSAAQKHEIKTILARYPKDQQRSALIPVLWLTQEANGGWLSTDAIEAVADMLKLKPLHVREVVSFYSMFYDAPVGKHHVQVCKTLPCRLRGAERILNTCKQTLNLVPGEIDAQSQFSLSQVECLGCCANGPVVQINEDIYEDLSAEDIQRILKDLQKGEAPCAGSSKERAASKPWAEELPAAFKTAFKRPAKKRGTS